jgi:hypothetical protein
MRNLRVIDDLNEDELMATFEGLDEGDFELDEAWIEKQIELAKGNENDDIEKWCEEQIEMSKMLRKPTERDLTLLDIRAEKK